MLFSKRLELAEKVDDYINKYKTDDGYRII